MIYKCCQFDLALFLLENKRFPKQELIFTCLQYKSFKKMWEKEKLLVTSNFSFSNSVFNPFRELSAIFIKFEIVVCHPFEFWSVCLKFAVWERVKAQKLITFWNKSAADSFHSSSS